MDQEILSGIISFLIISAFAFILWVLCYALSVRDICSGGAKFYVRQLVKRHRSAWMVLNSSYPGFYKLPATVQLYCLLSVIDYDCTQVNRRVLVELGDDHSEEK